MKKILIPTDFSKNSDKAVRYGVELANALNAKITFFKAYHPLPYAPEMYVYIGKDEIERMLKDTEKQLRKLSDRVGKKLKKRPAVKSAEGLAEEEIIKVMEEMKPDLTIMGSHGVSAGVLNRALFGSVTAQVARNTQHPLLIIPDQARYKGFKRLVYATDYHDNDIEAIRFLARLARKFDSEILILHVADGERTMKDERESFRAFRDDVKKAVRKKKLEFHLVKNKRVSRAIESFVQKEGADLVAVSRQKRSIFLKVFFPSLTRKMIYHTQIPLLVFNAWDKPSEDF